MSLLATINIPSKASKTISGLLDDKKFIFLENSLVILCIILNIIMPTLDLLLIGGLSLYFRHKGWKDIGLGKPTNWAYVVVIAIILAIVWQFISFFALKPLVENITGVRTDLSLFKSLYGNYAMLMLWLAVTWTLAAFGEEIAYRGYFLNRVRDLLGDNKAGWALGIIVVSLCFGLGHMYQGLPGMIDTGVFACLMGIMYVWNGKNLWLPIFFHGFSDTIGFLAIFFGILS